MSERKVLTKYYPPDFDPSLVGRSRAPKDAGPKVQTVRLMAPFSLRCLACGEYMYRGRKFNARKQTPVGERYLSIQIYRFFIRCTRCSNEIVFRTEPRVQGYVVEKGAVKSTEPWKRMLDKDEEETDEQRLDRIEREMAEAEGEALDEERNAMAELEAKTADAKREMAVADALDEIRSRNARLEKARADGGGEVVGVGKALVNEEEERRRREEEEDAQAARRAFAFARAHQALEEPIDEDDEVAGDGASSSGSSLLATSCSALAPANTSPTASTAVPSFKRQVKKKKDFSALLGIKRKQPPTKADEVTGAKKTKT